MKEKEAYTLKSWALASQWVQMTPPSKVMGLKRWCQIRGLGKGATPLKALVSLHLMQHREHFMQAKNNTELCCDNITGCKLKWRAPIMN